MDCSRLTPTRRSSHVSWFEADAFARAHGARLPSEAEWEKAATWDLERGAARIQPWGDAPVRPGIDANVDQIASGPRPVCEHPDGVSPYGCAGHDRRRLGVDREQLHRLPGVLRRTRTASTPRSSSAPITRCCAAARGRPVRASSPPTFRNWDFPQRRQIFSGIRIARDS